MKKKYLKPMIETHDFKVEMLKASCTKPRSEAEQIASAWIHSPYLVHLCQGQSGCVRSTWTSSG